MGGTSEVQALTKRVTKLEKDLRRVKARLRSLESKGKKPKVVTHE